MIKNIASGWGHSLIANDEQLYTCGTNHGELGLGHLGPSSYFTVSCTLPKNTRIIAIAAGFRCSYVVLEDNTS